ncbi:MAG TPA: DUF4399 domain-containing protein [Acidimicrobiales bacterium]|nr:DUF4399 domain-containing protein [Acidimicrobiales bacterium]
MGSRRTWALTACGLLALAANASCGLVAGAQQRVRFASPSDGSIVASPFRVEMRAEGLKVEAATVPHHPGAGHFHVIVDRPCFHAGAFIEMHTEGFEHYGGGETSAWLTLPPGEHTLCLQLADGVHRALAPTDTITVTVAPSPY